MTSWADMLPSISLVLSVEMIRDGGSLAAVFQGANGSEYWLFFELTTRELQSGALERLGYKDPVVVERLSGISVGISWSQAEIMLHQMRPLIRDSFSLKWLEIMEAAAAAQGQVPDGIERLLGKPIIS